MRDSRFIHGDPAQPPLHSVTPASSPPPGGPISQVVGALQAPLSQRLWGLHFAEQLAGRSLGHGVLARVASLGHIVDFVKRVFPHMLEDEPRAREPARLAAKQHYLEADSDLIEISVDGRTVGVFVGAPEDQVWADSYDVQRLCAVADEASRHFEALCDEIVAESRRTAQAALS